MICMIQYYECHLNVIARKALALRSNPFLFESKMDCFGSLTFTLAMTTQLKEAQNARKQIYRR